MFGAFMFLFILLTKLGIKASRRFKEASLLKIQSYLTSFDKKLGLISELDLISFRSSSWEQEIININIRKFNKYLNKINSVNSKIKNKF